MERLDVKRRPVGVPGGVSKTLGQGVDGEFRVQAAASCPLACSPSCTFACPLALPDAIVETLAVAI